MHNFKNVSTVMTVKVNSVPPEIKLVSSFSYVSKSGNIIVKLGSKLNFLSPRPFLSPNNTS